VRRRFCRPFSTAGSSSSARIPKAFSRLLAEERVVFYCGFDATAASLHCGSLMPIMAMAHLQRAGTFSRLRSSAEGTTMVGDPSGKTEMRQMLSPEEIERNGRGILSQLQRFLTLGRRARAVPETMRSGCCR
jgi:tyrosyl-tRNA synthetase